MDNTCSKSNLVELVEAGKELADICHIEAGLEEFLGVPKGVTLQRVLDLTSHKPRQRSVSNIDAFLTVVIEEARRRKNSTGDHMTVIFNRNGGHFCTDDNNRRNPDTWDYNRRTSDELKALKAVLDNQLDHVGLLRAMMTISNIVENFGEIYLAMRRLRIATKATINSAPQLIDGKVAGEASFVFQIDSESGTTKASFPAEFKVNLPMTQMSSRAYACQIEVEAFSVENKLAFILRAPALGQIVTQAVQDEVTTFQDQARKELPELLVVSDL